MKPGDSKSWLWKQVEAVEDQPTDLLSDEQLTAYREGRLPPAEREAVEQVLVRSSAHRSRLIEQVADRVTHAPDRIRERVRFLTDKQSRIGRSGRTLRSMFAVAALAASILVPLSLWIWSTQRSDSGFAAAQFQAQVFGSAEVRSEGLQGVAVAGTTVEVRIETLGKEIEGLSFGLYSSPGAGSAELRRVAEERYSQVERHRGAVWIRLPAEELTGGVPGRYTFYVVVADETLPNRVVDDAGDPARALERETGGKVYPLPLQIRAATD